MCRVSDLVSGLGQSLRQKFQFLRHKLPKFGPIFQSAPALRHKLQSLRYKLQSLRHKLHKFQSLRQKLQKFGPIFQSAPALSSSFTTLCFPARQAA